MSWFSRLVNPVIVTGQVGGHLRSAFNVPDHYGNSLHFSSMTDRGTWDVAARARVKDRWAQSAALWNTAMTDALLTAAELRPDSLVLDLAAGSGDPALTIARRLTTGRVIALDSSHAGLVLASSQAQQLGLGIKINFIQGDAHGIPLTERRVDRVTCRCGIMFFNDAGMAMSEVMRVLKPGGRAAFLAWGPFEQPFFEATVTTVLRLVRGAEMPPQAQTMFRFASPGSLETILKAAGFHNVTEERLTVARVWSGTTEGLWAFQQDVSTLCHPLFASIPKDLRSKVDSEVSGLLSQFQRGKVLSVPANIIVAAGQRS